MIYKTPKHAAKVFAKRYMDSLGGGWFESNGRKMQGLDSVARHMAFNKFYTLGDNGCVVMDKAALDLRISYRRQLQNGYSVA